MRQLLWVIAIMVVPALPASAQVPVEITFAWDASGDDTRDPASLNPVKYRLHTSATAPVDGAIPAGAISHEAGTALELMLPLTAGSYYVFATCYWCAVVSDGACSGNATVESGPSNVLRLLVQVPPGNPRNYRVRIIGIP